MDTDRLSRLKRLKALADRGIGGEKENAGVLFKKLCDKYHISPDQIESPEERKMRWFKHKRGDAHKLLLSQCIFKIVGRESKRYTHGKKSEIGTECNPAEAIEIELDYRFYSAALDKEMERLVEMFIHKNDIFPATPNPDPKPDGGKKLTAEDILMYQSIKKQTRVLQIGR